MQKDADPNVGNERRKTTPLECAISRLIDSTVSQESPFIKVLAPITTCDEALMERCQEMLDQAVENHYPGIINILLDLKLVDQPPVYVEDRGAEADWFKVGVWLRCIDDSAKEQQVLDKREVPGVNLQGHRKPKEDDVAYTTYSPATFVKSALPVMIYGSGPGVIIQQTPDRVIDYWYDGHREELTREMNFSEETLTHGSQARNHEYCHRGESEIAKMIRLGHESNVRNEASNGVDRYGILENRPYYCFMPWNEGLFRYQRKDIIGIFIPDSEYDMGNKVTEAISLASTLGLTDLNFYLYGSNKGTMSAPLLLKELQQRYGVGLEEVDQTTPAIVAAAALPPGLLPGGAGLFATTAIVGPHDDLTAAADYIPRR